MTSKRSQVQEDAYFRLLRLLQERPEMSQRELADAVSISTGSAHYLLSALIEKGLVKLRNFSAAEEKRRYAYVLTPEGIREKLALTQRFLARKMEEYEALKAEIEELQKQMEMPDRAEIRRRK